MITIYGSPTCSYCSAAKQACEENNLSYTYIDLFEEDNAIEDLTAIIGPFKTVPQIFDGEDYIGGFDSFTIYLNS